MPHLDPTYLRYIYDNLIKGSVHPDNASELPDGLIGLYEDNFEEHLPILQRQKQLQRFALFALLKKEVSVHFVSEILKESEADLLEFINSNSSWFNSAEPGKFQLYHERLKVYLLQKLSEKEIQAVHEKLISRLEKAIEEQKADEFEWYGLEFMAGHLGVSAMLNGDGKKLITLAYSQKHWQRQLKISKGYSWTKNGLREVMSWASKYNDDEVIECGLQMVDVHHQEQNAAPQIVALVAEGDFDSALKRIEEFGGNDEDGLQRKFNLYMLCLMELTLLDSKDKPFRKEGIEKLLKHLDEQLPVDHSVLNWNDFFPSYLIFKLAYKWEEIGLEYKTIFNRTKNWNIQWIYETDFISDLQIEILIKVASYINHKTSKCILLSFIVSSPKEHNKYSEHKLEIDNIIELARSIKNEELMNITFAEICRVFIKNQNVKMSLRLIHFINETSLKEEIIAELIKTILQDKDFKMALKYANQITNVRIKTNALNKIAILMSKNNMLEDALVVVKTIPREIDKQLALNEIYNHVRMQSDLMNVIKVHSFMNDDWKKYCDQGVIADQLFILGRQEESLFTARNIRNIKEKTSVLAEISTRLFNKGDISITNKLLKEIEKIIASEKEIIKRENLQLIFCCELNNQGKFHKSKQIIKGFKNEFLRNHSWKNLADSYLLKNDFNDAIKCTKKNSDREERILSFNKIVTKICLHDKFEMSYQIIKNNFLNDEKNVTEKLKNHVLNSYACYLFKLGDLQNAFTVINKLNFDDNIEERTFKEFSKLISTNIEYYGKDQIIENLEDQVGNWTILQIYAVEFAKIGNIDLAFKIADKLGDKWLKSSVKSEIIKEYCKIKSIETSLSKIKYIAYNYDRVDALIYIFEISCSNRESQQVNEIFNQIVEESLKIGLDGLKIQKFRNIAKVAYKYELKDILRQLVDLIEKLTCEISDFTDKHIEIALNISLYISIGLENYRLIEIENSLILNINENYPNDVSKIYFDISKIMFKENQIRKGVYFSKMVKSSMQRIKLFIEVSHLLVKYNEIELIEEIGKSAIHMHFHNLFWRRIGSNFFQYKKLKKTIDYKRKLKNLNERINFNKGVIESLNFESFKKSQLIHFLKDPEREIVCMEQLFNIQALKQLFFENASQKIDRYNRTLNLQWAIDLKKELDQLPN